MFSFRFTRRDREDGAPAPAGEPEGPLRSGLRAGSLAIALGALAAIGAVVFVVDRSLGSAELPDRWQRGMNLTSFLPDPYGERSARRAMVTARAAGTERIALVPTWYMETATDNTIFADPGKTPTEESIAAAAKTAADLGLDVVIKPHIDVRDGSFRGEILPIDPAAWFDSYRELLLGYAQLASDVDAAAMITGTELTSLSLDPEPWRALIDEIKRIYDGPLGFAANWVDGAESVEFWDALDFIGIDAYMPLLTADREPTVGELVEAWEPHKVEMKSLSEEWERPIVFTELGYESRVGTASRIEAGSAPISQEAQANAYEAAFKALRRARWFEGIWWWDWSAEDEPPAPGSFTPEGKLAEAVLIEWQGPREPAGG